MKEGQTGIVSREHSNKARSTRNLIFYLVMLPYNRLTSNLGSNKLIIVLLKEYYIISKIL